MASTRAASTAIRRAQVSFGATWAGESAFTVALAVVAFRDGGVAAVGLVTAVRMLAAAVLAPWQAMVADRMARERVLTLVGLARAVAIGGAALGLAAGGPVVLTYALAVVATVALALFRPAHSALLPALCSSPQQLTQANAVRGLLDSASTLGGPALAAVLLSVSGPGAVLWTSAGLSLLGGLVVVGLAYDAPPRAAAEPGDGASRGRDLLAGFGAIVGNRGLALVTGLGLVQTITRGALTVLTIAVAVDLLGTGEPGVGVLTAAVGAGGLVGSLLAFAIVGRGRLALVFGAGVALFGAPLALIGALPHQGAALVLLAVVGVGNALIDVGGFTILARLADERVLARMFAGFEAILTLGVAIGGLLAPVVIDALGLRGALALVGVLAPVAVLLAVPALRRLDADLRVRDVDIDALRAVPMLRALPVATIEQLAGALESEELAPGATVFDQGATGERFYVVRAGHAEVVRDGELVRTLGVGECFGEIALLHDRPRSATVRAGPDAPLGLSAISRGAYLTAVVGYPAAAAEGDALVRTRLEADAERAASGRGGRDARAPAPEHEGQAAPGDVEGAPEALEGGGLGQRGR